MRYRLLIQSKIIKTCNRPNDVSNNPEFSLPGFLLLGDASKAGPSVAALGLTRKSVNSNIVKNIAVRYRYTILYCIPYWVAGGPK